MLALWELSWGTSKTAQASSSLSSADASSVSNAVHVAAADAVAALETEIAKLSISASVAGSVIGGTTCSTTAAMLAAVSSALVSASALSTTAVMGAAVSSSCTATDADTGGESLSGSCASTVAAASAQTALLRATVAIVSSWLASDAALGDTGHGFSRSIADALTAGDLITVQKIISVSINASLTAHEAQAAVDNESSLLFSAAVVGDSNTTRASLGRSVSDALRFVEEWHDHARVNCLATSSAIVTSTCAPGLGIPANATSAAVAGEQVRGALGRSGAVLSAIAAADVVAARLNAVGRAQDSLLGDSYTSVVASWQAACSSTVVLSDDLPIKMQLKSATNTLLVGATGEVGV